MDLRALTFAAEGEVTGLAHFLLSLTGSLHEGAGIEFTRVFEDESADGCRHGETDIRVDVHLADTVLDGGLDFLDRNAIGFTHFTAELASRVHWAGVNL